VVIGGDKVRSGRKRCGSEIEYLTHNRHESSEELAELAMESRTQRAACYEM
jgi:hypothetical protein